MSTAVLVALPHTWESDVVQALRPSGTLMVVRRCVDLSDLLAAAHARVGTAALVAAQLPGLDRSALAELADLSVGIVGMTHVGNEHEERLLRQLGIDHVLASDASLTDIESIVQAARRSASRRHKAGRDVGDLAGSDEGKASRPSGVAELGRVAAVWGPTGAPGRSTLSLNLAAELAGLGVMTLLVDADPYGGTLAPALSLLDEAPGLAAAVRASDRGQLDVAMLASLAPLVTPDLRILTGLSTAHRWPELRASGVEHVLTLARRLTRLIVVDCGFSLEADEELSYDTHAPQRNAATLTVLSAADDVIVVGSADPIGLQRLIRGLEDLRSREYAGRRHVVVNKVRPSAVGPNPTKRVRSALARFAGVEDPLLVPDDRAALDGAMLAGRTLAEYAPSSPARTALVELAAHLAETALGSQARRTARAGLRRGASRQAG